MDEVEHRRRRIRTGKTETTGEPAARQTPPPDGEPAARQAPPPGTVPENRPHSRPHHEPDTHGHHGHSTDDNERGLRGLIGGGSTQVGVAAAMRARDAARPTDEDLAHAEATLTIVHRGWQPRDPA